MAGMLANMDVWLPAMQCAAAGSANAVTGGFFLCQYVRFCVKLVGMVEIDLRVPVKFPGWSQPGVSGLQEWMEVMRKAKRGKRVVKYEYMIGMG